MLGRSLTRWAKRGEANTTKPRLKQARMKGAVTRGKTTVISFLLRHSNDFLQVDASNLQTLRGVRTDRDGLPVWGSANIVVCGRETLNWHRPAQMRAAVDWFAGRRVAGRTPRPARSRVRAFCRRSACRISSQVPTIPCFGAPSRIRMRVTSPNVPIRPLPKSRSEQSQCGRFLNQ